MADALVGVTETLASAHESISSMAQMFLEQEAKMAPLFTNYSSLVQPGDNKVSIPRMPGFSTVDSKVENTAVDAQTITVAKDTIDLDQHKVIQFLVEDIASMQTKVNFVAEATERASKQIARDRDQYLINTLEAGISAAAPDHRLAYAGASIAEADILEARSLLQQQYLDPRECFMAINPEQEKSMLQISQFVRADYYGSNTPVFNGEIGQVYGIRVIVHNDIESLKTLVFHPSALGYADQMGMRFQEDMDLANVARRYSLDLLYGAVSLDSGKRAVLLGTAV